MMQIDLYYRSIDPDMGELAEQLIQKAWDEIVEPSLETVKNAVKFKFPKAKWPENIQPYWFDVDEFDETEDGKTVYELQLSCEVELLTGETCPHTGGTETFDEYDLWRLDDERFSSYSEPLATVDKSHWGKLKELADKTGDYWETFLDKCVTCCVQFDSINVVPSYRYPGQPHFYNNQEWL